MKPEILKGGIHIDPRGTLRYVNDPNPGSYRRFYCITPSHTSVIRAWQGHKHEGKGFYALKGSFTIAVVSPENFDEPKDDELPVFFELSEVNNAFLKVPGGCYTAIKSTSADSILLVLSQFDLEGSKGDDYRQPETRWVNWEDLSA